MHEPKFSSAIKDTLGISDEIRISRFNNKKINQEENVERILGDVVSWGNRDEGFTKNAKY